MSTPSISVQSPAKSKVFPLEKQGVKKGINKGKTEIILEMLKEKQPLDFIARVSKYSKEKISEIGRLNGIL